MWQVNLCNFQIADEMVIKLDVGTLKKQTEEEKSVSDGGEEPESGREWLC